MPPPLTYRYHGEASLEAEVSFGLGVVVLCVNAAFVCVYYLQVLPPLPPPSLRPPFRW